MANTTNTDKQVEYIALSKLEKSPLNARRTKAPIDDLLASIPEHGLLYPLGVYPGKKGKHLVFAGGRRLAALKALADEGKLPKDHPVPCQLYTEEQAAELSLVENAVRHAMHPADEFEAFMALVESGHTTEAIGQRFGKTAKYVEQRLKLGRCHPQLIQDYRDGKTTLEMLEAFTITDDQDRQLKVYKSLEGWQRNDPRHARHLLTEKMIRATSKLVGFVGLDTYEKAGGSLRRDLFGKQEDTYLENPELLDALVTEKLKLAEKDLLAEGWAWVKVDREQSWSFLSEHGRLKGKPVDVPQELIDEQAALEKELVEVEKQWDEMDSDDEAWDAIDSRKDAIEERLADIEEEIDGNVSFDADQKATAGAYAYLDHDGTLDIERGLVKRQEAKKAAQEAAEAADDDQAEPKPKGLSESLKRDLEAYRLGAAQAEIAKHPAIAFDLLVFKLTCDALDLHSSPDDGTAITCGRDYRGGYPGEDARKFADSLLAAVKKALPLVWHKADSEAERFAAFQQLTEADKQRLLAFCVAASLKPKLAPTDDDELTAYDIALAQTGANVADYWRPTTANFLSRVKSAELLEIGQEIFGGDFITRWGKAKKAELVAMLDRGFTKRDDERPDIVQRLKNWLPAGMAFGAAAQPEAEAQPKPAKGKKSKKAA